MPDIVPRAIIQRTFYRLLSLIKIKGQQHFTVIQIARQDRAF